MLISRKIQAEMDRLGAILAGPALLIRCTAVLRCVRSMEPNELDRLPPVGINHVAALYNRRYELAPESAWAEGSVPGEIDPALAVGVRLRVAPRANAGYVWVTFEANGRAVPRDPDEVMRYLGLPWSDSGGAVLRVEVPIGALRTGRALFALPTLFDSLDDDPTRALVPD